MRVNIKEVETLVRNSTSRGFSEQTVEFFKALLESMVNIDKCEELIGNPLLAVERLNQTLTVLSYIIGELKDKGFNEFRDSVHEADGPNSKDKFKLCILVNAFRHLCLAKHMLDLNYGDMALDQISFFWRDVRVALNQ